MKSMRKKEERERWAEAFSGTGDVGLQITGTNVLYKSERLMNDEK
jgi:hypothetical protein